MAPMYTADEFAASWLEAWNGHDLEKILSHYADAIEFTSPRARQIVPESGGVVRGKEALRSYWEKALAMSPDLRFDLEQTLETVAGATLLYRNHRGQRVVETFFWDEGGLVVRSSASYAAAPRSFELCMIARVPPEGVEAFQRYEEAVLPLLAGHGGALRLRLRSADATREVHLVSFRDEAGFAAYRGDPARAAHAPTLAASGAITEVFEAGRVLQRG